MDDICKEILQYCSENNLEHFYQESLESTNDFAKGIASKSPINLVFCKEQTAGRGRYKRSWLSPEKGKAILATWVLSTQAMASACLPAKVGIAMHRSLHKSFPNKTLKIKAPNDLYLEDKKIAGILIEAISTAHGNVFYIGTGINWSAKPFDLSTAGFLTEQIKKSEVHTFLDSFLIELNNLIRSENKFLDSSECEYLKNNYFLLEEEKLTQVSSEGDLIFEDKIISWRDL